MMMMTMVDTIAKRAFHAAITVILTNISCLTCAVWPLSDTAHSICCGGGHLDSVNAMDDGVVSGALGDDNGREEEDDDVTGFEVGVAAAAADDDDDDDDN
jgi:hypothetical protein